MLKNQINFVAVAAAAAIVVVVVIVSIDISLQLYFLKTYLFEHEKSGN